MHLLIYQQFKRHKLGYCFTCASVCANRFMTSPVTGRPANCSTPTNEPPTGGTAGTTAPWFTGSQDELLHGLFVQRGFKHAAGQHDRHFIHAGIINCGTSIQKCSTIVLACFNKDLLGQFVPLDRGGIHRFGCLRHLPGGRNGAFHPID